MATPTNEPAEIMVCFQFVTSDRSVIETEPEPFKDIKTATQAAHDWMQLKGRTLQLITFEGFGVAVRTDKIDHITAMTAQQMADIFAARRDLDEEIPS